MLEYIIPIGIFLGFAVISGILLTVASKAFAVATDDTVESIIEALPGVNCGACGYSGCEGYANAVAKNEAPANMCKPGGDGVVKKVSEIMGVEVSLFEREVAFVHCNGNCNATKDKYQYVGTPSCHAVNRFYNGKGDCQSGCLGLGDCVAKCEWDAISIQNGVAVINPLLCKSCEKCVKTCPNNLITMRKESQLVNVICSSADTGKVTRTVCKNGCIACKICEKKCPKGAIYVDGNHAHINAEKCDNCGICIESCPTKCIVRLPDCK